MAEQPEMSVDEEISVVGDAGTNSSRHTESVHETIATPMNTDDEMPDDDSSDTTIQLEIDASLLRAKRFLLFGRTGAGKSTLADMISRLASSGPIVTVPAVALPEEDAAGTTESIDWKTKDSYFEMRLTEQKSTGLVILEVDPKALSTAMAGDSKVSHKEAKKRVSDLLKELRTRVNMGFHFYAFVRKWGKTDVLDIDLWNFFKCAFDDVNQNFVVMFTNYQLAEDDSESETRHYELQKLFQPCRKWMFVDFPDPRLMDDENDAAAKMRRKIAKDGIAYSCKHLMQKMSEFGNVDKGVTAVSPFWAQGEAQRPDSQKLRDLSSRLARIYVQTMKMDLGEEQRTCTIS